MSVKETIFIILVCVFAIALYLTIIKKLLDICYKISEKNSEKNTPTKTDDDATTTSTDCKGRPVRASGGCDINIWETEQGQKTLEEVYSRINNIGGCGATEPWDKGYDDGITAALGKIEEMMIND